MHISKARRKVFFFVGWLIICLIPLHVYGQLSRPGTPPGFSETPERLLIDYETMPAIDIEALQAEDMIADTISDIPWRFGDNIAVDLNPWNSGTWQTLENGNRLWRLGIRSPGALSINLSFNRYKLPPGAELYVYNNDRTYVLGAFSDLNNQEDRYFATTVVPGEAVIIEYVEPADVAFRGELNLETVTHAYRSVFDYAKGFGHSGPCHLNVACREALGWQNETDAVVMIMVGSNSLCSGVLINNLKNDGHPYLLSANHCYRQPSNLVFWFNFQSESCENPSTAPPYNSMSGATSLVRYTVSDVWLLELNQKVPPSFNPYFAGWNRTLDLKMDEKVVSIHHPRGDIKKFSYATDGADASAYLLDPGTGTTFWRVIWSGGTSTEPASSGSPLFDSSGRIIGQLYGGHAACGNELPDWFGRFGISWGLGQTDATRLKSWLDPFETNVMVLPGYRPEPDAVTAPGNFQAQPASSTSIELSWLLNQQEQSVMIAYSPDNIFGHPKGAYSLADTIAGGGIVLYLGSQQNCSHNTLEPGTTGYYRMWSFDKLLNYSDPVSVSGTTIAETVTTFPYSYGFENNRLTEGWKSDPSGGPVWEIGIGNSDGQPPMPYQGNSNAFFFPNDDTQKGKTAMLVSPSLDFGNHDLASLTFYYTNLAKDQVQDLLNVYFRENEQAGWTLAGSFTASTEGWTHAVLDLPVDAGIGQLGFEAQWNGGYGICLDAVVIDAGYDASFAAPQNLVATVTSGHSVLLSWDAINNEKEWNPEPAGYKVYRDGQPVALITDPTANVYSDSGLAIRSYVYHIKAVYKNPDGISALSEPAMATIEALQTSFSLDIGIEGNGTVEPSEAWQSLAYNAGAVVSLKATPGEFSEFKGWYFEDTLISPDNSLALTMDRNVSLTAVFEPLRHILSLSSLPEDIGVQLGGGIYEHSQAARVSTTVPFGWRFLRWMENGQIISTNTSFYTGIDRERSIVAEFEKLHLIEVSADPPEAGVTRGNGLYETGRQVDLMAWPSFNYTFSHWEHDGEIVSDVPDYSFQADQDIGYTAVFAISEFQITAEVSVEGAGVISGTGTYFYGDTVSLEVDVLPEWNFIGWRENGQMIGTERLITFQATSDRHIIAVVQPRFVGLVISIDGSGTTIPAPGTYNYEKGAGVTLIATPNRGWRFKHWNINGTLSGNSEQEIFLNEPVQAQAVFTFFTSSATPELPHSGISAYPNPTSGKIFISAPDLTGSLKVDVYDILGQHLLAFQTGYDTALQVGNGKPAELVIDLGSLRAGMYILKVSDQSTSLQTKIIVQ